MCDNIYQGNSIPFKGVYIANNIILKQGKRNRSKEFKADTEEIKAINKSEDTTDDTPLADFT